MLAGDVVWPTNLSPFSKEMSSVQLTLMLLTTGYTRTLYKVFRPVLSPLVERRPLAYTVSPNIGSLSTEKDPSDCILKFPVPLHTALNPEMVCVTFTLAASNTSSPTNAETEEGMRAG